MPATPSDMFDRHHAAIYRYVLRMTGRQDVAEDVTQDVFVRVLRNQDRYEGRDREQAWLFRIARNLLIDMQRRAGRSPFGPPPAEEPVRDSPQDLVLAVRQAIGRLDADDRDVFLLRMVGGLGHDEIASIAGLSPAAVRSRIYRARAALRLMLKRANDRTRLPT